jgi:hypothetical protein
MLHRLIFKLLVLPLLLPAFQNILAQESHRPRVIQIVTAQTQGEGKVEIYQDKKVEELQNRYISSNANKKTITVYTLRLYSGSTQGEALVQANNARNKFKLLYPEYDVTKRYENPNWKVYGGYFRNKTDAFRLFKKVKAQGQFKGLFITTMQIDYTKL